MIIERLDELAAYFEELGKEPNMLAPIDASNGMLIRDAIKAISDARSSALEEAARVIDENAEGSDNNRRVLVPRNDGNLAGLGYASAIRALKDKP